MKKILLLIFLIFHISYACPLLGERKAWGQPEELTSAKRALNACYYNLQDNSNRIGIILLNKNFSRMQTILIIQAKTDIDLAAQITIGTMQLYMLQSLQSSVPDKAKHILKENCYNSIYSLSAIQDRLGVILEQVKDKDTKIIILSSIDFVNRSKQAIEIIFRLQEKGIFIKEW